VQHIEEKMKEHSLMQKTLKDKRKVASTAKNTVCKEYAAKLEVCLVLLCQLTRCIGKGAGSYVRMSA
jgi:hypothetical protein